MKKWHKIALLVILIVGVCVAVRSCVDRKSPDLTIAYIGFDFVDRGAFDENVSRLYPLCNDITADGEINIDLMEVSFNDAGDKANAKSKLANAVGAGVARLYIIDKDFVSRNKDDGVFMDISSLGDGIQNASGEVVAISVNGNEALKDLGIDSSEDLYVAVRIVSEVDELTDKTVGKKTESAWNIAEYILNK